MSKCACSAPGCNCVNNSPTRSAIRRRASNAGSTTMTDAPNTNGFFERGGAWVLIPFVLLTAVIVLAGVVHGDGPGLAVGALGVALLLVGGVFGIAGVMVLGRNRTPFPQPHAVSELVQRGIYGVMRHPPYTSVRLASLGWALIWQSWPALI